MLMLQQLLFSYQFYLLEYIPSFQATPRPQTHCPERQYLHHRFPVAEKQATSNLVLPDSSNASAHREHDAATKPNTTAPQQKKHFIPFIKSVVSKHKQSLKLFTLQNYTLRNNIPLHKLRIM